MSVIEEELKRLPKEVAEHLPNCELICCVASSVQVRLKNRNEYKQLILQMQFREDYPSSPLIVELKSKTISDSLLSGLVGVCDAEARKLVGQKQLFPMVKFVQTFVAENPLIVCSDELNELKRRLLRDCDEVKVNKKAGTVTVKVVEEPYHMQFRLTVPEFYPTEPVGVEIRSCNYPPDFTTHMVAQASEIGRQCVQRPLRPKPKDPPFKPQPSFLKVAKYLVSCAQQYPVAVCPLCKRRAFSPNAEKTVKDECADMFVERAYCDHLYHHGCLDQYMKTPPFAGGKKCPACGDRIFHDKYKISPKVAEQRWAHQEAKRRELAEVVEFLGV